MDSVPLGRIVDFLDDLLETEAVPDYDPAWNGLQVENRGTVHRVATAVDAARATIERAAEHGADLLIVHHGLFWGGGIPLTGTRFQRIRLALEHDMAVYSSHMPLDVHPEVGNNILLSRALGIDPDGRFGSYGGTAVGYRGTVDLDRDELADRLSEVVEGPVQVIDGGPERIRTVGVITGGASSMIPDAIAAGLDAFITGEAPHHAFFDAQEGGVNVLLGGHYATETFGVRRLGEVLSEHFRIPATFIPHPTGM